MPLCALTREYERQVRDFGRPNWFADAFYEFFAEVVDCRSKTPGPPVKSTSSVRQSVPQIVGETPVTVGINAMTFNGVQVVNIILA